MEPNSPIGVNASFRMSFGGSGNTSWKFNVSAGYGFGGDNLKGVAFVGFSVYNGTQLGASNKTNGPQYDITGGIYGTNGTGNGNSHVVNTLNPDTPSKITNDFKSSTTYGQMFTLNSPLCEVCNFA